MAKQTVVVTGMGAVSPLGLDVGQLWDGLMAGQSGIGPITHFDASAYACRVAGEVKGFDPAASGLDAKDYKKCDRFILLGLAAMREAMAQAGLLNAKELPEEQRQRMGVILGTGIGGLSSIEDAKDTVNARGPGRIGPFFIPAMLPNMLAGQASILYGLQGPNVCPVSACATSAHAIGWGKRMIEWGEADVVIVGGAEATVCPTSMGGFASMRALSTGYNDAPAKASRPFDTARDGFLLSEGAAVLVLESEAHAKARGAKIIGKVAGFGQTADAGHMTLADGKGSSRAMSLALADAGLQVADIGYVNAHATSTPMGDELEGVALKTMFGDRVPVSSTKGATGHLLGAAGAIEAVISLKALETQMLPGTLNLENVDVDGVDIIANTPRKVDGVKAVLSNSFGFGGTNASLVVTL
ncbi:MAG: beta-ketoacyl-[acyl-carrier-protein] synthase II [Alphaproteobacteria bacterium]|nr:MAG: beta-ketoacyl-[acyl-carrier-protein] synthase II [Alphaproteobacteria bacterium]